MGTAKTVVVYEDGMNVKVGQTIKLEEGDAVVREITEGLKILVQFNDSKIRPNWRELEPETIGCRVIRQEAPKPPLGLMPRYIWISQRTDEINAAIERYKFAQHPVPRAWLAELAALQSSTFIPCTGPSEDINDFTRKVQYQPAYSQENLTQMMNDVVPFVIGLGDIDVEVIDSQLVNVADNKNQTLTPKFSEEKKNFAYVCAFLLNNARNILLRN